MFAILCATAEEVAALRVRLDVEVEPELHGPTRVWRGWCAHGPLVLAQSGIGKVNAAAAATLLLSLFDATSLIFCGVAGGLDPALPVGAVLLADRLAIHDYGVVSQKRLTATASGLIPLGAPQLKTLTPVSETVRATLEELAQTLRTQVDAPVVLGGIVTADYFLNCTETRRELHERFGAQAIDMESGSVHQIAQALGAPLYVVRTLSDLAGEESHLTYPQMAQMAAHNSALCVLDLLRILGRVSV